MPLFMESSDLKHLYFFAADYILIFGLPRLPILIYHLLESS